ncbi:MAG: hypothetical protein E7299_00445 [Lachnospiraceae bacterium]|nr:hypothetical protein [Lachnospiraceae bacterium]
MKHVIKHKNLILSVTLPLVWIFLITITCGIYFETNDDRLFSEIFSGAMTGTPEFRSYYIHPFLGLFITFFYHITTAIPWYGLLLILFQWICHASFTYAVLSFRENRLKQDCTQKIHTNTFSVLFIAVYYSICFTFIAHIQFTSTAAMLAVTGYMLLFLTNFDCIVFVQDTDDGNSSSKYGFSTFSVILFFILQVLSYMLRSDSMLMIQPYGMAMLFTIALCHIIRNRSFSMLKVSIKLLVGTVVLIVFGIGTHFLFHHDEGWTEYEKVNQGVTEITDYSRIPDYKDVQSILEKYDVSEKQYLAFFQYAMIEPNLSGDCLLEVAEYARNTHPTISIQEILSETVNSFSNSEYFGIGKLTLVLWLCSVLYVIVSRNFLFALPLVSFAFTRTIVWSYLVYRGRTPFRVIFPLWVIELLFFMLILFALSARQTKISKTLYIFSLCVLLLGSAWILKKQYTTIKPQNVSDKVYNGGYIDLIAYCDDRPDNHYFLDAGTLLYYRGSAYTSAPFHPRNSLITGCWYSGAPVLYERTAEYAPQDITIHLVVSPDLPTQSKAVLSYFEEWRGTEAVFEESFTVSNGGVYEVYKF